MDPRAERRGASRAVFDVLLMAGLAGVYFVLARAGLRVHAVGGFATLVWPPSGISLAALLILEPRFWPGIAAGAFLANLATGAPPAVALGIAAGNAGEALFAAWSLRRIVGFRPSLDRLQDVLGLVLLGGVAAPVVSATVGVASLQLGGLVAPGAAAETWRAWWLGDAIAILVITPLLLTLHGEKRSPLRLRRLESYALALLLALATLFLFYLTRERASVVIAPFLIWAAVRFDVRGAARANFLAAAIAAWATIHGHGPFAGDSVELGLVRLQGTMAATASTFLVLGAMTAERRRAERERLRVEAQIRESEARYRSMTDAVEQLMWMSDARGDVVYLNRRWEDVIGSRDSALGSGWIGLTHPDDLGEVRRIREAAVAEGRPYSLEFRLRTRTGYRWVLSRVVPVRGEDGAIQSWFGAASDVHDLKTAQEDLRRARDEAEEANHSKDRFLATLSHELRTPLTPVLALSSRLERDPTLPEAARRGFVTIRRNAELEARLIDDLLDVTRVASGKLDLRPETIGVLRVLDDAVETCAGDAAARGIALTTAAGEETWVRADPARLRQVVGNLVQNAVKFTPRGGRVTVGRAMAAAGRIAIEIADTGTGIEPQELTRIFRPFEQATHRKGGLGLGLSIARSLVEAHGGTLSARSGGAGEGSVFRIELPGPVAPPEAAERRPSREVSAAPLGSLGSRRVLLVEDHADSADAARELLADASCQVVAAGSLAEALEAAGIQTFDLVLSDLGLPDGSGLDLMRDLRDRYGLRGIALTGYGMEDDIRRSREAGFVDHLVKPITYDRLLRAIDRFFDGKGTPSRGGQA